MDSETILRLGVFARGGNILYKINENDVVVIARRYDEAIPNKLESMRLLRASQ